MDNLTVLGLDKETVAHYKQCFDDNGWPKTRESIEWQFLDGPVDEVFVDISFDPERQKTAAIYAVASVPFKIGDKKQFGTQSMDTITDVDYRGKGLFVNLAKDVYKKAAEAGAALVYGFPNGNSIHGFRTKLGWTVLDPVPFLIKPLRSGYFTSRVKWLKWLPDLSLSFARFSADKNYAITTEAQFPDEATSVWEKFAQNIQVAVDRSKTYLDWRYLQKPGENYSIAHCRSAKGEYLGYVVFVTKDKHNGKIGYIMELMHDPAHLKAASQLLAYAVSEIRKQKADCILSWCLEHSPNYASFKKAFFLTMPEKLRPIELHFGAAAFTPEATQFATKRENWYLSYSDSDTV